MSKVKEILEEISKLVGTSVHIEGFNEEDIDGGEAVTGASNEDETLGIYGKFGNIKDYLFGGFTLTTMRNCCGSCILSNQWTNFLRRNEGIGTLVNKLAVALASSYDYGNLICTYVPEENVYYDKVLEKNGWKEIHRFVNPRTGNEIVTATIDLNEEDEED